MYERLQKCRKWFYEDQEYRDFIESNAVRNGRSIEQELVWQAGKEVEYQARLLSRLETLDDR